MRTVQLFGSYFSPATFMLALDGVLIALGVLPFMVGFLAGRMPPRIVRRSLSTFVAVSIGAGSVEYAALSVPSAPHMADGSSWFDAFTMHILLANIAALMISLVIATYFARPASRPGAAGILNSPESIEARNDLVQAKRIATAAER